MAASQSSRPGSDGASHVHNQVEQLQTATASHNLFISPAENSSRDSGGPLCVVEAKERFALDSGSNESQSDWHSSQHTSSPEIYGPGVQVELLFDAGQPDCDGDSNAIPLLSDDHVSLERIPPCLTPWQVWRWKNTPGSEWSYSIIYAINYKIVADVLPEDENGAMESGHYGVDIEEHWRRARYRLGRRILEGAYVTALQYEEFARTYTPHTISEWLEVAKNYDDWSSADLEVWAEKYHEKHTPSLWKENAAMFESYLPTKSIQAYSLRRTRSNVQVAPELGRSFSTVFRTDANGHLHHPNGPLWSPRSLFPHEGKRHSRWVEKETVALWDKMVAWKRYTLVYPHYTAPTCRKRVDALGAEIPSPEPDPSFAPRRTKSLSSMKVRGKTAWERAGAAFSALGVAGEGWAFSSVPSASSPLPEAKPRKVKGRHPVHFTVRNEKVLERRRIHDAVRGWKMGGSRRHQRIYDEFFWTEGIEYVNNREV